MDMRRIIALLEAAALSGTFFHGTATGKPRSTSGLYLTNSRDSARRYADTAAEQHGGEPVILAGTLAAAHPCIMDQDTVEALGYSDEAVERLAAQGYDSAATADGYEVFLVSHADFHTS